MVNRKTDFFTVKVWDTVKGYYHVQRTMVPISGLPEIIARLNIEDVLTIRSSDDSPAIRKRTK